MRAENECLLGDEVNVKREKRKMNGRDTTHTKTVEGIGKKQELPCLVPRGKPMPYIEA